MNDSAKPRAKGRPEGAGPLGGRRPEVASGGSSRPKGRPEGAGPLGGRRAKRASGGT
jgi:hypothetical protein